MAFMQMTAPIMNPRIAPGGNPSTNNIPVRRAPLQKLAEGRHQAQDSRQRITHQPLKFIFCLANINRRRCHIHNLSNHAYWIPVDISTLRISHCVTILAHEKSNRRQIGDNPRVSRSKATFVSMNNGATFTDANSGINGQTLLPSRVDDDVE